MNKNASSYSSHTQNVHIYTYKVERNYCMRASRGPWEKVGAIQTERGLALADIVRLLCEYVFRLHMPQSARAELAVS